MQDADEIFAIYFYISFYHGIVLAGIFSSDPAVVTAGADYLKAYAIDCLLTAIFFCYVGFYNGIGLTKNKEFGCNFGRAFLFLQNGYNFPQWVYAKMELR